MKSILLSIAWLISLFCSALLAAESAPLKVVNHLPMVSLFINGNGPYDLLLDTGTEATLVDRELAQELQLLIIDRVELMSLGGMHLVGRAIAGKVSFGPERLNDVELLIDDLRELHRRFPRLRGVLGLNVLRQFNFLLDYRHGKIEFDPHTEAQAGIPFSLEDGRMILTAKLPGSQTLRFQLDSGTSHMLLFRSGASPGPQRLLRTNDGAVGVYQVRIPELNLGSYSLRDIEGIHAPARLAGIDGLLPTNLFDSVYFDFARCSIAVTEASRKR